MRIQKLLLSAALAFFAVVANAQLDVVRANSLLVLNHE